MRLHPPIPLLICPLEGVMGCSRVKEVRTKGQEYKETKDQNAHGAAVGFGETNLIVIAMIRKCLIIQHLAPGMPGAL